MSSTAKTTWTAGINTQGALGPYGYFEVQRDNGPTDPIDLKSVCYSPCPINGSNASAPNLGDWFWDSFSGQGYGIEGWDALWQRDLPRIRGLGANSIRVYSMLSRQIGSDGKIPDPWDSGHLFTHQKFLDMCWNGGKDPLYVLVGIPMPDSMYWLDKYKGDENPETLFWTFVLQETATQLGSHPAVLGFTIQNELDGAKVTYADPKFAEFWWGQAQKFSYMVKLAAPRKLVGMAVHDDPQIPERAREYMAKCTYMDFWGVNTYQTVTLDSVFEGINKTGYNYLPKASAKPVLLTEFGIPATSHRSPSDPATIYDDAETRTKAANVIGPILKQAFAGPGSTARLCTGVCYFEYCDEWWNQPGSPNIYTWWGGTRATGFPNGYWDQDGFGLHSIHRGKGLKNHDPIWVQDGGYGKPAVPIDVHTERAETANTVRGVYQSVGSQAAGAASAAE